MSDLEKRWLDISDVPNTYETNSSKMNETYTQSLQNFEFDKLFTIMETMLTKVNEIDERLKKMEEDVSHLTNICSRMETSIISYNEREVNLQIRKYNIKSKEPLTSENLPLSFVPTLSTNSNRNHFNVFRNLLK